MRKKRLPPFDYEKMQLIGQTLYFAPDRSITCGVVSARKVDFRGHQISQTEAARRAVSELGLPANKNGTPSGYHAGTFWQAQDGASLGHIWWETVKRIWPKRFNDD